MWRLSNISIRNKILMIPFLAVIGFFLVVSFSVVGNKENTRDLQSIEKIYFPVLELANSNIVTLERINEALTSAASTGDEDALAQVGKMKQAMVARLSQANSLQPSLSEELSVLNGKLNSYYAMSYKLTADMVSGDFDFSTVAPLVEKKNSLYADAAASYQKFYDVNLALFNETIIHAEENGQAVVGYSIIVGVVTALVLVLISITIVLSVTKSLSLVTESLKDIAHGDGDLTQRIEKTGNDEVGELVEWFNQFVSKIHLTMKDVVEAITPLTNMAKDLNLASSDSAAIASEQQQSSEKMSESVSDLLSGIVNVADHARSAAQGTEQTDTDAKTGMKVVTETVDSISSVAAQVEKAVVVIGRLESDADSVGGILDVIKGIAEQTNLLALNAAIEAARAGEQGRGFAVVADEVRTLASRTQESTQEIQQVVEELQSAALEAVSVMDMGKSLAESSVQHAGQTGDTLEGIVGKISSITEMNQLIVETTEEQHRVTASMKEGMVNMQSLTGRASASNEKTSELGAALQDMAAQLQQLATQFKV